MLNDPIQDNGGRPFSLKSTHLGKFRYSFIIKVFLKSLPVRRDVARIAYWKKMSVRHSAKGVANLKSCGFLTLNSYWINRVDDLEVGELTEFSHDLEGIVEASLKSKNICSVHDSLGELAKSDLAGWQKYHAAEPCPSGIGSRRS